MKIKFIFSSLFSLNCLFIQAQTVPWNYSYFPATNKTVLISPNTILINSIFRTVNEVELKTNSNTRLRLHPDGLFQFNSRAGYILAVNHQANYSTIITQGGGNSSGFASFCNHTTDWAQNIVSLVNRANSVSFVVNYNGSDRFFVAGAGWLCANNVYFNSDIKLKTNIKPLNNALSRVLKLQGVSYQMKPEKLCEGCSDQVVVQSDLTTRIGFIAQEVEKVVPEVVRDMPSGLKAVAYADLVALAIEAIKEQQNQIETLKMQVKELQNKVK